MIDYRAIEALFAVHELQSFEAGAKKLHITQSAISQRIKGLETSYGEPLLIRVYPYQLTDLGKKLITHYKKICLLEEDLLQNLGSIAKPRIAIALNRDSIETWFLKLIQEKDLFNHLLLEIIGDDQELTLGYLKNGQVSACLSTVDQEILGGECAFVGNMEYLLVATPAFKKSYFSKKSSKKCLLEATAVKFDQNDHMHEAYVEKFFGMDGHALNFQVIPSVRGFKQVIMEGYGYGLVPRITIEEELKKNELVEIFPGKTSNVFLYWHYWAVQSEFYRRFNAEMISYIREKLPSV